MTKCSILGFPRIGASRELKKTVEAYWKKLISDDELADACRHLRNRHWHLQQDAGIDHIPSNDFSMYDQVLDTIAMVGAVPERYNFQDETVDYATYFAMARGNDNAHAMEMTKWFDTNYHYIVPEFESGQQFKLSTTKIFDEFTEAKSLGIMTRPVLLGPISFLMLGKTKDESIEPVDLIEKILPVYKEVLEKLALLGAQWVQIDEPILALDLSDKVIEAFSVAYKDILAMQQRPKICLATYFGSIEDKLPWLTRLSFEMIHLDLVRGPAQLDWIINNWPESMAVSMGLINGRNIWAADLNDCLGKINTVIEKLGSDNVIISSSCSLLHCPVDLDFEDKLDPTIKARLSFARQKLSEIKLLADAAADDCTETIQAQLDANQQMHNRNRDNKTVNNPEVADRLKNLYPEMFDRKQPFIDRKVIQKRFLNLPILPTTTIGSFPQTSDIRKVRAGFKNGSVSQDNYRLAMQDEIQKVITFQEAVDLDVLVHGEPERNDMVEYFAQFLQGFTFTANGWVQSYGSRCVKPPVIFGDVSRPKPMTVQWAKYAQSLTDKYVKGMLTGPVTMLQWSFVREDKPRSETAFQIALAIRDEVHDLQEAGIKIIQIDEPALREGVPLRKADWQQYFDWAIKSFRLSASAVDDQTQIHTHMCYSDFNDIIAHIADLDADVISIEASRSDIELLDVFAEFDYPNEIGPGVYDIHSPRIPPVQEIYDRIAAMLKVLKPDQLWINPDCGLKTRDWPETEAALANMVLAAKSIRQEMPLLS
ncbi:MAG: 5-methyltetrahydropteroyltriglutamate--homocysteine S-methyltransferase [Phycisphaerae bacterium]|nr:5-methyltetrahydropteroyltriglutamate--homocysteine S-methyltransferase [Phycisphaerae bacterium]